MFDVVIYYIDGRRSMYDHVISINDNTAASVGITIKTDFGDTFQRLIAKSVIAEMRVLVYE